MPRLFPAMETAYLRVCLDKVCYGNPEMTGLQCAQPTEALLCLDSVHT